MKVSSYFAAFFKCIVCVRACVGARAGACMDFKGRQRGGYLRPTDMYYTTDYLHEL